MWKVADDRGIRQKGVLSRSGIKSDRSVHSIRRSTGNGIACRTNSRGAKRNISSAGGTPSNIDRVRSDQTSDTSQVRLQIPICSSDVKLSM